MHLFHKWTKWESFERKSFHVLLGKYGKYLIQQRTCLTCGLIEENRVSRENFIIIRTDNENL